LVHKWWDDDDTPDEERLCRTAIVAWKISITSSITYADKPWTASWTTPITADCSDWSEMEHWVLGPDGMVYRPDEVPVPFGQWLEWKKRQLAEKRQSVTDQKAAA
jgi:hypothetical protein